MVRRVKASKDDLSHNRVNCPYCGETTSIFPSLTDNRIEPLKPEEDDRGYPITQIAYNTLTDCKCTNCGRKFIVNKGVSKYNVYLTPRNCCNMGEIRLMAEFISDNHSGYSIYIANNPSAKTRPIYFIKDDDYYFPIFITKKEAQEYLKDHHKTLSSLGSIIMSRTR